MMARPSDASVNGNGVARDFALNKDIGKVSERTATLETAVQLQALWNDKTEKRADKTSFHLRLLTALVCLNTLMLLTISPEVREFYATLADLIP